MQIKVRGRQLPSTIRVSEDDVRAALRTVEDPEAGWDTEPCTEIDDWSLWATASWRL